MLHPSYTDLMKVVNKDVEEGETKVVNSRYSIVMATAKRARQIIDGSMPLVPVRDAEKPLSIAIDELNQSKITIIGGSLRINLPLDPDAPEFNDGKMLHTATGHKKVYAEVPFQFKVNSKLALKRALRLIEMVK